MTQKSEQNKSDAHTFFATHKTSLLPREDFVEELREKVLNQYVQVAHSQTNKYMDTKLPFWKRKQILMPLAAFGVIVIILAGVIGVSNLKKGSPEKKNQTAQAQATKLGGEIAFVEGAVEYKEPNGGWFTAKSDLAVKEGYSLRVNGAGRAVINLDDGSAIRLSKDSAVTLSSLDPKHITISNDKGNVYTRVVKAERTFEVKVKDVTYKSLGTAYKTVNEETLNGVEVFHSTVNILGINAENKLLVEQGQQYYVVNTLQPELQNKVTPVSADEIQKDEFVMWNKTQDETVTEFKSQMGVLFDLVPPVLTVTAPTDGLKTTSSKVTVTGTAEVGAKVSINDAETTNTNGSFSHEISLNEGANGIKVIATDPAGNKTVKNITVTRQAVPVPTATAAPTPKILLTGTTVDGGISLTWNVANVDVSQGFKVVKSTSPNPVYPDNYVTYLSNPSTRSYTIAIKDGVTYHIRVCQYIDGKCGLYSNDITVKAPLSPAPTATKTSGVSAITVTANSDGTVKWSTTGYSAMGFKVTWSKNSGPTYPTRTGDSYQYFSNPSQATSDPLTAFDGAGTYYVRVCEYLGGKCGVYSNQISVNLNQ